MQITLNIDVVGRDELSPRERELADAAVEASHRSYAPYSHFNVGAAIALDNGQIIQGSNQENAAFPSGTCAERTAAFYAHSRFPDSPFAAIAIAARDADGNLTPDPVSPCGACRQALLEFEKLAHRPIPILLIGARHTYRIPSVASLLPLAFTDF